MPVPSSPDLLHSFLAAHAALNGGSSDLDRLRLELEGAHRAGASPVQLRRRTERFMARCGKAAHWPGADAALEWSVPAHHHIVAQGVSAYPELLGAIARPPPVLFVTGEAAVLNDPQVAVVGSRQARSYGLDMAARLGRSLACSGLAVTSGLAYGIDAQAHEAALGVEGIAIAVLGCGIDRIYPREHADLATRIAQRGCLVSEFPLGAAPRPQHFPRRNRIIAGLALGVVVVQAARASGSMSTAMHALQEGREVFAVPGPATDPLAHGGLMLLQQGAKLVIDVGDILGELAPELRLSIGRFDRKEAINDLDSSALTVLECCGFSETPFDHVVRESGLTPSVVSSMLAALELKGLVRLSLGGTACRIKAPGQRPD